MSDYAGPEPLPGLEILRGVVGSTVYGLSVGGDDRDEMSVIIEYLPRAVGFDKFDHYVYRTAHERTGTTVHTNQQPRSQAGDLDLVVYSLQKFVGLIAKGNPSKMLLLFVPREQLVEYNHFGVELQSRASEFVTKTAGRAYLHYMIAQRERLIGERGQKNVKRPELTDKFGYDTKYAMHMLRLGYQAIELLTTGKVELPIPESTRRILLNVRRGVEPLKDVLALQDSLEVVLNSTLKKIDLPEKADISKINRWLVEMYQEAWS